MLLFLELNEVNFEFVRHYADRGALPQFKALIDQHGYSETTSEQHYEELEPWIQWVTAHTGLSLAEHGVHHLGDIVQHDLDQIWEKLARHGMTVGAISPMNAKCRNADLAFFVPDPWTRTDIIAPPVVQRLYRAISQAVNDNAKAHIGIKSLLDLAAGMISVVKSSRYMHYVKLIGRSRRRPWLKSVVLDQLLADLFIKSSREHRVDFATLFLNAAAHIQHHYMFCADAYQGEMRNPAGYAPGGVDPLFDVYAAYDVIIGDIIRAFPDARVMLATGLHQDPHPAVTYYWRLHDHAAYLRKLGIPFTSVHPRMSRDFKIDFANEVDARRAGELLESAATSDGERLFEIDDVGDGKSLFVMLAYPHVINSDTVYTVGDRSFDDLHHDVTFVALKNGQHNGVGYFLDTHGAKQTRDAQFQLKEIPDRIFAALPIPVLASQPEPAPLRHLKQGEAPSRAELLGASEGI